MYKTMITMKMYKFSDGNHYHILQQNLLAKCDFVILWPYQELY